jgi:signal recognition particle GTPase
MSEERRERGKAPFQPLEKRCALAEDHPDPMCLGGFKGQGKLPPGAVLAYTLQARREESHLRRRASVLTAAYHMLKNGTLYQDLGANFFDNHAKSKQVLRLVNRLQNLGYDVQIAPQVA